MRSASAALVVKLAGISLFACSGGGGGSGGTISPPPPPPPPLTSATSACINGMAGDFACNGISLQRRVTLAAMGGNRSNDIWGWADPVSGNEYALVGLDNGVAFVDVTDPQAPTVVGRVDTETVAAVWRDVKVHADHAFIVADNVGAHGMQVFDLTRLRFGQAGLQTYQPDVVYGDFGSAHNIAINEGSGFAYVVGSDTCGGGLHMIDLSTPLNPLFAGCHTSGDTHDTQCVVYQGPDPDHAGSEICASSNEDHVEIADVTSKSSPVTIATMTYPDLGFVHQGWLTEDHRFLLIGDELDELRFAGQTRTHIFNVEDLDNPAYIGAHELGTPSIDHNLYVLGNRIFEANYSTGLRVLEFTDLAASLPVEIASFDTVPSSDVVDFVGAWSVYPYLPSGNIVISDTQSGLFIVSLQ